MVKFFNFYSCCEIIRGFSRSVLIDNQRQTIKVIPNSLTEIINLTNFLSYNEILNKYDIEQKQNIDEYFSWLIENELGLWCDSIEKNNFPNIKLDFDTPYIVDNAILDFNCFNIISFQKRLKQIIFITVPYLQIRIFDFISFKDLELIVEKLKHSTVENVEIIIKFMEVVDENLIINLVKNELRIHNIVIYQSAFEKKIDILEGLSSLTFIKNKIIDSRNCGTINMQNFSINQKHFMQSKLHNSCLHKKISIDKDGNIKNCPSMPQSYGNIKDTTLEEALNHPDFKKYWNVTKDMINVCKDCEFRHICNDCRAYTERTTFDGEIDLSKPLKCGYNPYTNEWAEWSTNPLKEKAIEYYGMQDLVKKDA
jgi:SPASM domain peptide maturase of grasp-with-spasm system